MNDEPTSPVRAEHLSHSRRAAPVLLIQGSFMFKVDSEVQTHVFLNASLCNCILDFLIGPVITEDLRLNEVL